MQVGVPSARECTLCAMASLGQLADGDDTPAAAAVMRARLDALAAENARLASLANALVLSSVLHGAPLPPCQPAAEGHQVGGSPAPHPTPPKPSAGVGAGWAAVAPLRRGNAGYPREAHLGVSDDNSTPATACPFARAAPPMARLVAARTVAAAVAGGEDALQVSPGALPARRALDDASLGLVLRAPSAPLLRVLSVRGAAVTAAGLVAACTACPGLESLDAAHCRLLGEAAAAPLAALPRLAALDVSFTPVATSGAALAALAVAPRLATLRVAGAALNPEAAAAWSAPAAPPLADLDVGFAAEATDDALAVVLGRHAPSLRSVRLSGCCDAAAATAAVLGRCAALRSLEVAYCAGLPPEALLLLTELPLLAEVDLGGLTVPDEALKSILSGDGDCIASCLRVLALDGAAIAEEGGEVILSAMGADRALSVPVSPAPAMASAMISVSASPQALPLAAKDLLTPPRAQKSLQLKAATTPGAGSKSGAPSPGSSFRGSPSPRGVGPATTSTSPRQPLEPAAVCRRSVIAGFERRRRVARDGPEAHLAHAALPPDAARRTAQRGRPGALSPAAAAPSPPSSAAARARALAPLAMQIPLSPARSPASSSHSPADRPPTGRTAPHAARRAAQQRA